MLLDKIELVAFDYDKTLTFCPQGELDTNRSHKRQIYNRELILYDKWYSNLARISQARKRIGIITNNYPGLPKYFVCRYGIEHIFTDDFIGSGTFPECPKRKGKPKIFMNRILQHYNLSDPGKILFIGDGKKDLKFVKETGCLYIIGEHTKQIADSVEMVLNGDFDNLPDNVFIHV